MEITRSKPEPVEAAIEEICDNRLCIKHGTGTAMCQFDGRFIAGIDIERWQ